jgi:hypothetical protein
MWPFNKKKRFANPDYVNLVVGETVPTSGNYICEVCRKGGMFDVMAKAIGRKFAGTEEDLKTAQRVDQFFERNGVSLKKMIVAKREQKETRRFFREGEKFTECPTCGPATGWTFLE